MALTEAQIESVREIAGESSFVEIENLCGSLNTAQETATVEDIDSWDAVKAKHLKIAGGSDGVDMDFERDRQAIRTRVRLRLGLSATSAADAATDPNAIMSVNLRGASWF